MIRSAGLVLLMAPIMAASLNAAPRKKAATVSSLSTLMQQVGGSLGIAILTTVLTIRTQFHASSMGAAVHWGPAVRNFIQQASALAIRLGHSHREALGVARALLLGHVRQTSAVAGFQDVFLFGMLIVLAAIVPALFLPLKVVIHKEHELIPLE